MEAVLNHPMADKIKPLTEHEKSEARRIKAIYEANKERLGLTQERLGELLGTTQGAISHWLNGRSRISDLTLLRFASYIQFDPESIRPGIMERLPKVWEPTDVSERALRFAREFDDLSAEDQSFVADFVGRLRISRQQSD